MCAFLCPELTVLAKKSDGHATALLAEVGIPPLHLTQTLQLALFRYRLSTNKNNIIPHTLYVREQHARAIMHDDTTGKKNAQSHMSSGQRQN